MKSTNDKLVASAFDGNIKVQRYKFGTSFNVNLAAEREKMHLSKHKMLQQQIDQMAATARADLQEKNELRVRIYCLMKMSPN